MLTNFLESVTFDEPPPATSDFSSTSANTTTASGLGAHGSGFFSNIFGVSPDPTSHAAPTTATSTSPPPPTDLHHTALSGFIGGSGGGGGVAEYADPRMRAIPLLTKIFLQRLSPLYNTDNGDGFARLWSRILVCIERYATANLSDSLNDAVRESLKNLLLVMFTGTQDTSPILRRGAPEGTREARLWAQTERQLASFMPNLMDQLFPPPPPVERPTAIQQLDQQPSTPTVAELPEQQAPGPSTATVAQQPQGMTGVDCSSSSTTR